MIGQCLRSAKNGGTIMGGAALCSSYGAEKEDNLNENSQRADDEPATVEAMQGRLRRKSSRQ